MKKILLLFALLIFAGQSFGQTSEELKISYEKNRSGKEIYYISKIITKIIATENMFLDGSKNIKKTIKKQIFDVDTLSFIDTTIPLKKQLEAYAKGFAGYDTVEVSAIYYSKDFWLSRGYESEYKLAQFNKIKKEIKASVTPIFSPTHKPANDIILLLIVIIVISNLLCCKLLLDSIDRLIGVITFVTFIGIAVMSLLNVDYYWFCKSDYGNGIAVFSFIVSMILIIAMTRFIKKWDTECAVIFAVIACVMSSVLIGLYTHSWTAFLTTIGFAITIWLIFWLIVLLFCFIFRRGITAFIKKIFTKRLKN